MATAISRLAVAACSTSEVSSAEWKVRHQSIGGVAASNKVYDGGTTATLNTTSAALVGLLGLDAVTLGTGSATGTFGNRLAGPGKTVTVAGLTISGTDSGNGKVGGGVLVFHDVSESRELNRRLSYHASHDLLTGLVNRREFENRLERALKSARARETSYALCYLDIDQFKIVNDTCCHSAGDALLGQVGALLKSKVRWRDTLSRLGGDEFGILLESCSLDEAMRTSETLRELATSGVKRVAVLTPVKSE